MSHAASAPMLRMHLGGDRTFRVGIDGIETCGLSTPRFLPFEERNALVEMTMRRGCRVAAELATVPFKMCTR
jgi:hypothetical protein